MQREAQVTWYFQLTKSDTWDLLYMWYAEILVNCVFNNAWIAGELHIYRFVVMILLSEENSPKHTTHSERDVVILLLYMVIKKLLPSMVSVPFRASIALAGICHPMQLCHMVTDTNRAWLKKNISGFWGASWGHLSIGTCLEPLLKILFGASWHIIIFYFNTLLFIIFKIHYHYHLCFVIHHSWFLIFNLFL